MTKNRCVYLVGAGPGDPELLTVKARRLIGEAGVVVYDRLVSDEVLALIPPDCTRVFVGKEPGRRHKSQAEINEILVSLAAQYPKVLRLKGGDPFIFGRGSEEALFLTGKGIAFEVVPGVSAASGVSAALGLPLTHRGMATGVRLVTGKCRAGAELDLDWKGLADPNTTIVFYMGLANLPLIARELMAAGLSPETPAAVVYKGTTQKQRQIVSTIQDLPAAVAGRQFRPPALIIIGQVVRLSGQLNWQGLEYENGPE